MNQLNSRVLYHKRVFFNRALWFLQHGGTIMYQQ